MTARFTCISKSLGRFGRLVNKPDSGAPLIGQSQQNRDLPDRIVNRWFFRALHEFASKGVQPGEDDVGADTGKVWPVVVARPSVQHPQRVPLGGLPAVW